MINFIKLAPMQDQLDAHIRKKQGLEGQDLLLNTIFALQVEVAELANEVRFFKHWSKDQEPRTAQYYFKDAYGRWDPVSEKYWRMTYGDPEDKDLEGERWKVRNPVLVEYVDCLHFLLSIGNQAQVDWSEITAKNNSGMDMQECFGYLMILISNMWTYKKHPIFDPDIDMHIRHCLSDAVSILWQIAQLLNFTAEDIEAAYLAKHEVNYERQAKGY
ncbi:dUTP diphosphatase [Terribacillus halophilus]|uniref:dUTP diphosphatase n=1 Tax=Terribacillus halophilus TaxID=361279 RepID=UPI0039826F39